MRGSSAAKKVVQRQGQYTQATKQLLFTCLQERRSWYRSKVVGGNVAVLNALRRIVKSLCLAVLKTLQGNTTSWFNA